MDGERRRVCPRCDEQFDGAEAYAVHRRDVHGQGDDGPDLGALDLGVLAAAAASLARSDGPGDGPEDGPEDDPEGEPEPLRVAGPVGVSARHRRAGALAVLGGVPLAVAAAWWALGGGDDPTVASRRSAVAPVVEVEGTSQVPATTVPAASTLAPDPSPSTTAQAAPPASGAPGPASPPASLPPSSPTTAPTTPSPPTTTSPPATTTTTTGVPPASVTATEATVVRCTEDADERTLVFTYVLTGSADDGLHEASVSAPVSQGPIVVATVPAVEPDGDPVTVPLQPGPVTCG